MPRATDSIGIDTGGTFVDCVVVGADGTTTSAKALATAGDRSQSLLTGLESLASGTTSLRELLARAESMVHGTTLGLNTLITRSGSRIGLLTTRGHEDALLIGRIHQKVAGLTPEETTRASQLAKPEPLVPRSLIRGISERIDFAGDVVVPLDEAAVAAAARELVDAGCEALAISFLWSFKNDAHERRAREVVTSVFAELPVSLSSEIAPVLGEYERTATVVVNAYLSRRFAGYLEQLARRLREAGFRRSPYIMTSSGGIRPMEMATRDVVQTLGSGPAAGVIATQQLGADRGLANLIATDVGGTSFDVGLVVDGAPVLTEMPIFEHLHLIAPAIDIRSIGAGGGSIAWVDDLGALHVGPRSAGSTPGPVCYGLGGTEPTVTDADLILGRVDANAILGDTIRLDKAAATRALRALGAGIGLDAEGCAAAIVRIIDAKMADLVRRVVVERGLDVRSFTMVAYGGAGPLHVGAYAPDVGVGNVLVSPHASVFSALGLAGAEYRAVYLRSDPMTMPADPAAVDAAFVRLEQQAAADFATSGLPPPLALERGIDLRFRRQTHRLTIPLSRRPMTGAGLDRASDQFASEYERVFGTGTAYRPAGIEVAAFRVTASAPRARPRAALRPPRAIAQPASSRRAYFGEWTDTPVYASTDLGLHQELVGPALVEAPGTTTVLHPGQVLTVDDDGNLAIRVTS
jgi:N-methylhydantoinase A